MFDEGIEQQHWRQIRDMLLKQNVLVATSSGRYVLTRDPGQLKLIDVMSFAGLGTFEQPGLKATESLQKYPWSSRVIQLMKNADQNLNELFSPTLAELFGGLNPSRVNEQEVQ